MVESLLFFVCCIILTIFFWHLDRNNMMRSFERKEEVWVSERKDLLDRIQAPTFTEYTNKVIREKKAEQPEEEEEQIEFIS